MDGWVLCDRFRRLYSLSNNMNVSTTDMCSLGWGTGKMGENSGVGFWLRRRSR